MCNRLVNTFWGFFLWRYRFSFIPKLLYLGRFIGLTVYLWPFMSLSVFGRLNRANNNTAYSLLNLRCGGFVCAWHRVRSPLISSGEQGDALNGCCSAHFMLHSQNLESHKRVWERKWFLLTWSFRSVTGDPDREILAWVGPGTREGVCFYPLRKPNGGLEVLVLLHV